MLRRALATSALALIAAGTLFAGTQASQAYSKADADSLQLKLNADLVTLSACRTAVGKLIMGEGVVGLSRAFIYAGARSTVVSLWNVNDVATAELMKSFYQNLGRGMAKDEALRQAKLALLRNPQRTWHHPYYWAPFVLVGEPN